MASVAKRKWTYNGQQRDAWVVRYFDATGTRRSKQFDLKKQADGFARQVERELEDGTHTPDADTTTVEDAADAFLRIMEDRYRAGRLGRSRITTLRNIMKNRVIPFMGEVRMKDVSEAHMDDLHSKLLTERGISPATAKRTIGDLAIMERFARRRKFTRITPINDYYDGMGKASRPELRAFTRQDIAALLIAARTPRYKGKAYTREMIECFVSIAALCGLRIGEICGLRREDIDLCGRALLIRRSLTQWDELKEPKTRAGVRTVPMPELVAKALSRWLEFRFVPNERDLVFRTEKGGFIDRASLHRSWRKLLKQAGLEHDDRPFRFHGLRHFFASDIIDRNPTLAAALSITIGHQSIATTMQTYVHRLNSSGIQPAMIDQSAAGLTHLIDARRVSD